MRILAVLLIVVCALVACSPDETPASSLVDPVTLSFFSETYATSMEAYTLQSEQASLFFSIGDLPVDESGKFTVILGETILEHEVYFPGNTGTIAGKMVISEAKVEGVYSKKSKESKGTFSARYTLTGVENGLEATVDMSIVGTVVIEPTEYEAHKGRLQIWFEGESERRIEMGEEVIDVTDENYSASFIYSIHE